MKNIILATALSALLTGCFSGASASEYTTTTLSHTLHNVCVGDELQPDYIVHFKVDVNAPKQVVYDTEFSDAHGYATGAVSAPINVTNERGIDYLYCPDHTGTRTAVFIEHQSALFAWHFPVGRVDREDDYLDD